MRLFILILFTTLSACGQQNHKVDRQTTLEAKRLSDSASKYFFPGIPSDYKKAMVLLNKAISIDSQYLKAYKNKITFELMQAQYDSALITSKKISELFPDEIDCTFLSGLLYEKKGDTISSKFYFLKALENCNRIISATKKGTDKYFLLNYSKGINLIFLDDPKGKKFLNDLFKNEHDETKREFLKDGITKSKQEILYLAFNPEGKSANAQ